VTATVAKDPVDQVEVESRAKGWIYEKRLTFQVLNCNPNRTRVENITENLNVGRPTSCCLTHRTMCMAPYGNGFGGKGREALQRFTGGSEMVISWAMFFA
jgi:hypothetical protein